MISDEGKRCSRCNVWKPLSEYHKQTGRKGDIRSECKDCARARRREYTKTHKQKIAVYMHNYRETNRDVIAIQTARYRKANLKTLRAQDRERYEKHRETKAKYNREYYEANKEQLLERKRQFRVKTRDARKAYRKRYREANREALSEYQQLYRAENADKHRADEQRRRARKQAANGGDYTTADMITARWNMFGGQCYLCGIPAEETDHVKPLARGGAHWPCNLRPICKACNASKGATWPYPLAGAS